MKTAAYVLREEQIEWLKQKAEQAGHSPASAVLRRILTEAMERDMEIPAPSVPEVAGSSHQEIAGARTADKIPSQN